MDKVYTYAAKYKIPVISAVIFIGMSLFHPYFFSSSNIYALCDSISPYGIAALGLTFVIITGNLDISIGSIMALSSIVFALSSPIMGFAGALIVTILSGIAMGAVNGLFIAYLGVNSFIISLSTMITYQGIGLVIAKSGPIVIQDQVLRYLANFSVSAVPLTFFLFLLLGILCEFILKRTVFGRNLYPIGGGRAVAESVGINVKNHIFGAFLVSGGLSSIAGLVLMTRLFSASANNTLGAALTVIPMIIIGGTTFSGGRGGTIRTLFGAILMGLIINSMALFNIYVNIQQLIKGVILLSIVVSVKYNENKERKI